MSYYLSTDGEDAVVDIFPLTHNTLLPEQLLSRINAALLPERKLYAAVLFAAFEDADSNRPQERSKVISWIEQGDICVVSLEFLCSIFNLSYPDIKRRLRSLAEREPGYENFRIFAHSRKRGNHNGTAVLGGDDSERKGLADNRPLFEHGNSVRAECA